MNWSKVNQNIETIRLNKLKRFLYWHFSKPDFTNCNFISKRLLNYTVSSSSLNTDSLLKKALRICFQKHVTLFISKNTAYLSDCFA